MSGNTNSNRVTTETVAQTATPKSPLIPAIKSLGICDRLKVGTTYTKSDGSIGKLTSKTKQCLGIPSDRTIVWAHVSFTPEDYSIYEAFCKSQDLDVADVAAKITMQWFEDNREEITKTADGFIKAEHTAEDLTKRLATLQRQMDATAKMLEIKMAALTTAEDDNEAPGE